MYDLTASERWMDDREILLDWSRWAFRLAFFVVCLFVVRQIQRSLAKRAVAAAAVKNKRKWHRICICICMHPFV
jgi:hypothetical protein